MSYHFAIKLLIVSLLVILVNFFFLKKWIIISKKINIVSHPTSRGLHNKAISTSGGIIFFLYLILIFFLNYFFNLQTKYYYILIYCGVISIIFGILDDKYNLKPIYKILTQSFLAIVIMIINQKGFFSLIIDINIVCDLILSYFFLIIIFNACNFIDGADGTLLLFKAYILTVFLIIFSIKKFNIDSIFFILSIFLFLIPLLYMNIKKFIFLGESGSFFISLSIIIIILYSIDKNILSIKHWILISSYFFWDIFITFLLRIYFYGKKAFQAHKDHAYQNFIFKKKNHQLFNFILLSYKFLIVIPVILLFESGNISFVFSFILISFPSIIFIIKNNRLMQKL